MKIPHEKKKIYRRKNIYIVRKFNLFERKSEVDTFDVVAWESSELG